MMGNFARFLSSVFNFINFCELIQISNILDPDQARQDVDPDLGQNCFQRLSAKDKSTARKSGLFCSSMLLSTIFQP